MNDYGARVERGRVIAMEGNGARVASLSRTGVVTPPLAYDIRFEPPISTGDGVFFFVFEDGSGRIIGRFEGG